MDVTQDSGSLGRSLHSSTLRPVAFRRFWSRLGGKLLITKSHQCIQHPTRLFNRLGRFERMREDWSRSWFMLRNTHDPHAELGQSLCPCAVSALHSPNTPSSVHIRLIICVSGSNTSGDSSVSRVSMSAAGDGDIDAAADDNAADTARLLSR